ERERRASLALAPAAVATVDEQRRGLDAIAYCPAGATAFERKRRERRHGDPRRDGGTASRPPAFCVLPGPRFKPEPSTIAVCLERVVPRRGLHGDPAQFGELVDARLAAEAPDAAALDAAERHLRLVVDRRAVDVTDPRLDAARDVHCARDISAEHRRAEPVLVVVGAGDRLVDAVHPDDALHRRKGLLVID